jgi:DtxR family Mn-dependent transcriptional regulator
MKALTPSLENYLEAIWITSLKEKVVRVKDIVKQLNVKTASVVGALKILADKGLVIHEKYGYVELTQQGTDRAKKIYERHETLTKFFHEILDIDFESAVKDACQVEHYLNKDTMERIVKFIKFIETCPEGEPQWLSRFRYFVKHGEHPEQCCREGNPMNAANETNPVNIQHVKLSALKAGQEAKVVRVSAESSLKKRLLDMGVVPGTKVRLEKIAPLGDPIDIVVKGYHLSLRKQEASAITVEILPSPAKENE